MEQLMPECEDECECTKINYFEKTHTTHATNAIIIGSITAISASMLFFNVVA